MKAIFILSIMMVFLAGVLFGIILDHYLGSEE